MGQSLECSVVVPRVLRRVFLSLSFIFLSSRHQDLCARMPRDHRKDFDRIQRKIWEWYTFMHLWSELMLWTIVGCVRVLTWKHRLRRLKILTLSWARLWWWDDEGWTRDDHLPVRCCWWRPRPGLPLLVYGSLFRHRSSPDFEHLSASEVLAFLTNHSTIFEINFWRHGVLIWSG